MERKVFSRSVFYLGIFFVTLAGCGSVHTFPEFWPERGKDNGCPNISGTYKDKGQRGDIKSGNYDPGRHLSKVLRDDLDDVGDFVNIAQTKESIEFVVWKDGKRFATVTIPSNQLNCENGAVSKGAAQAGASLVYWSALVAKKKISFSLLEDFSLGVRESSMTGGILLLWPIADASNNWARFERVKSNHENKN